MTDKNLKQNRLPKGWEIKKLKEIAYYFIGLTYSPKDVSDKGIIVLRSSNVQNGKLDFADIVRVNRPVKDSLKVKDGDILMCSRNGSKRLVGKTATIQGLIEEMTFGTFMTVIRSEYNSYLSWFLISDEFREQIGGGENPMINQITKYMLDEIVIPLPPFPQQLRIVSILDEAFAAIATAKANAEQNFKNAKELFDSYLQNIFENKGYDWEEKILSEICEVKDGTHDSPKYIKEGIPFVTQKNIRKEGLSFADTKFITDEDHNQFYKRSNVSSGDILISMIGANRGMACIVDDNRVFSIKNVGLIKSSAKINVFFLLYYLKSSIAMRYILFMSNGGAQEFVGLTALRSFPIPFPPLKEQQTIVLKLNALSAETKRLEAIYRQKLVDLEELKKSVLQKAFSGEL
ncbi:MAG: restriction endonuclease subunit S [Mariniphaga sp.]